MANLRFVGNAGFDMVLLKDGKYEGVKRVRPGDEVDVSDEAAERFLRGPRFLRNWVEVGSEEDPESNSYKPDRYSQVSGNATPYPELDMGSTVQPRQAMFVTEDDNPHGFDVASPDQGTPSDNAELYEADKANQKAEEARKAASKPAAKPQGGSQGPAPANTANKA